MRDDLTGGAEAADTLVDFSLLLWRSRRSAERGLADFCPLGFMPSSLPVSAMCAAQRTDVDLACLIGRFKPNPFWDSQSPSPSANSRRESSR